MRTESIRNSMIPLALPSTYSKTDGKPFDLLLTNENQKMVPNQSKVTNADEAMTPFNMVEVISQLGLTSDDQKVFLEFLSKLEQMNSQDDESQELFVNLLGVLQTLIQTEPSNLKEAIKGLPISNKDTISQLIQNSTLADDVDIKIAYFILLGHATNNISLKKQFELTNPVLNSTPSQNQVTNEVIKVVREFLQMGQHIQTGVTSNQEHVENDVVKILQFIEKNSNPTKVKQNEYLLSLYKRNFVQPMDQKGSISEGMEESSVSNKLVKVDVVAASNNQDLGQTSLPINRTHQFIMYISQNQQDSVPNQEKFIQDFKNILAKSQFSLNNGLSKLLIKLYPEHLGSVQIELIHQDKMVIAKIMTTTANAKELLESQIQNLKHTLQAQNIPVEKIEVSQQLQHQFERSYEQEHHHEQQQQEKSTQEQKQTGELNESELTFAEELLNFQV